MCVFYQYFSLIKAKYMKILLWMHDKINIILFLLKDSCIYIYVIIYSFIHLYIILFQ